ncbi:Hypothetical protein, putative [Bodo saltans]|uniref:Uncharacterized protein n=1 Tax=Bodo saltans TaxID=75058 RepID=A0A0S4IVE2_BODSA|nr:Hypothetical protein, putative [Bodo saltans]|eukprot:CUG03531.1 Hypothetical protein, putative [Bodo saltans]
MSESIAAPPLASQDDTSPSSVRGKWRDASRTARMWDQVRFGGEADLFSTPSSQETTTTTAAALSGPSSPTNLVAGQLSPSAPSSSKAALLAKATKSFSRRLADVAQNVVRIPPLVPLSETASRRHSTTESIESRQTQKRAPVLTGGGDGAATANVVAEYLSFVLTTSEAVFQQHVWQRMPHDAPPHRNVAAPPSSQTSTVVEPSPQRNNESSPGKTIESSTVTTTSSTSKVDLQLSLEHMSVAFGCLVPALIVEQSVMATEVSRLSQAAFPGGFSHCSASHGIQATNVSDVSEHLKVLASNAVRQVAADLMLKLEDMSLNEFPQTAVPMSPTEGGAAKVEGRHTVSQTLHKEGMIVTLWKSRRAGKLYQRSIASLNHAIRCCLLPSAFQGLLVVAIALDGFLFTVTCLPAVLSGRGDGLVNGTPQSRDVPPSPMMESVMSLLSVFLVREDCPTGCVRAYATADTRILLVPDVRFLSELQSCRTGMHFASMLFVHCLPEHSTPKKRLIMTLRKFILSRDLDFRRFIDRRTLLRDMFHAAGANMKSLLDIRSTLLIDLSPEALISTISFDDSREAASANVAVISNLILTECVARTLKAMILSRVASTLSPSTTTAATTTVEAGDIKERSTTSEAARQEDKSPRRKSFSINTTEHDRSLPAKVCDIATDILRRFATSEKFFQQSLIPAMSKKFSLGLYESDSTLGGRGLLIDKTSIRLPDVVTFLQHRLGIVFDPAAKKFIPQSQLDGDMKVATTGSAARLLWSTAYGVDASIDVTLPGLQSVSLRGSPGQLTMGHCSVYAESLSHFLRQKDTLHPAAVSCGVLLAAYFSQCAVELKIPGAWSASVSALDMRVMKHRHVSPLCLTTVSVMHQFVLQWIQAHARQTKRKGSEGVDPAATLQSGGVSGGGGGAMSVYVGEELGSFFATPGLMSLEPRDEATSSRGGADVLSVGMSSTANNADFRACTTHEEVSFIKNFPSLEDSVAGDCGPQADAAWVLFICTTGGLHHVRRELQLFSAAKEVKHAQAAASRALQTLSSWSSAICASRHSEPEHSQWVAPIGTSNAFDYLQAFQAWRHISTSSSTKGLESKALRRQLCAAAAIAVTLTSAPRRNQRGITVSDSGGNYDTLATFNGSSSLLSTPGEAAGSSSSSGRGSAGAFPSDMVQWAVNAVVTDIAPYNVAPSDDKTSSLVRDALVDLTLRLPQDDPRGWLLLLLIVCPELQLPWVRPCCAEILRNEFKHELANKVAGDASQQGTDTLGMTPMIRELLARSVALLHRVPKEEVMAKVPPALKGAIRTTSPSTSGKRSWSTGDLSAILERLRSCRTEGGRVCGALADEFCGGNAELLLDDEARQLRCLKCFRERSPVRVRRPLRTYAYDSLLAEGGKASVISPPSGKGKSTPWQQHLSQTHPKHTSSSLTPSSTSLDVHTNSSHHRAHPPPKSRDSHSLNRSTSKPDKDKEGAYVVLNPLLTIKRVDASAVSKAEEEDRHKLIDLEATMQFNILMDYTLAAMNVGTPQLLVLRPPSHARGRRQTDALEKSWNDAALSLVANLQEQESNRRAAIEEQEGCSWLDVCSDFTLKQQSMPDATHRRRVETIIDGETASRHRLLYSEAEAFALDLDAPHRSVTKRWFDKMHGAEDLSWIHRGVRRSTIVASSQQVAPSSVSPLESSLTVSHDHAEFLTSSIAMESVSLRPTAVKKILHEEMIERKELYEGYDFAMEYIVLSAAFNKMDIEAIEKKN